MQLQLQTVLNLVHPLKSFVYADVRLVPRNGSSDARIEARVESRKNSRPRCTKCQRLGPTYDHQPLREFKFVPLWGLLVFLLYELLSISQKRGNLTRSRDHKGARRAPTSPGRVGILKRESSPKAT